MGNTDKTKEELTKEISALRRRVTELRKSEAEHKQAEEALRESENRFHKIADNAADSIWTVDLNMKPTYISPSITLLLGYSIEEAMAKPMEEIFTPASFEVAMKALTEELAIEKIDQKDLLRSRVLELELYRKDGSTVPVETRYSFLRGADTKPVEILAIARDITKRKRMEEALRDSERKYRELVESSVHGVAVVSGVKVLFVNKKILEMYRYDSEEEVKAHPFTDFLTPEYRVMMRERGEDRERGAEQPNFYKFKALRKDGTTFDAELVVNMIE